MDYGLFLVPGGMVRTIILLQLTWFSLGPLVRLCGVLHDPTRGWGGLRGQSAQYCLMKRCGILQSMIEYIEYFGLVILKQLEGFNDRI